MKKLFIIILFVEFIYMQCNASNWQDYYNSDGWNMEYCDLAYANLSGENLSNAWLWGVNFSGANLIETNLSETNLTWANLAWANLSESNLSGADLSGADFLGANLEGACLENAINFIQINYLGTPILEGCENSNEDCLFVDENGDGYDDASYISGYVAGHGDGVVEGTEGADMNNDGLVDRFPVISIIDGPSQIFIQNFLESYIDSGATCVDQEDGAIFHQVEVSGDVVNMSVPGMYVISYNCSDSDGNAAQTKHRIVFVLDECLFLDENEDGYDDASYIVGATGGDINLDLVINVADIVSLVNLILSGE